MTKAEFMQALKKAKKIFGAVIVTENSDPTYFILKKSDMQNILINLNEDCTVNAVLRGFDLYIN